MVGCWLGLGWAGRVGVLGALIFGDVSGLALGAGGGGGASMGSDGAGRGRCVYTCMLYV